jgi:uncharacterized protein
VPLPWASGARGSCPVSADPPRLFVEHEAKEVLRDLAAIAQVQDALEESEDGESDYMEVMEYLRVAPLLLFTETKKTAEAAAAKPSLH